MQVSELLTLMGNLSIGNDNITAEERAIFLQYLNLVHYELYQITANLNQDLIFSKQFWNKDGKNEIIIEPLPYLVVKVYDKTHKQFLPRISLNDLITKNPLFDIQGNPCQYSIQSNIIQFYPFTQGTEINVGIWFVPQPSPLTEETTEDQIPYPLAYHPVLVDGALYYLFQEEGGFKNAQKAVDAQERWANGKSRLLSYFYTSSGERLSTFSSV